MSFARSLHWHRSFYTNEPFHPEFIRNSAMYASFQLSDQQLASTKAPSSSVGRSFTGTLVVSTSRGADPERISSSVGSHHFQCDPAGSQEADPQQDISGIGHGQQEVPYSGLSRSVSFESRIGPE